MFDGREKGVCGCATKNGNEGRVRAAALMRKDDEEIPLGPFVIDRRVPVEAEARDRDLDLDRPGYGGGLRRQMCWLSRAPSLRGGEIDDVGGEGEGGGGASDRDYTICAAR